MSGLRFIAAVIFASVLFTWCCPASAEGRRLALVIGNDQYQNAADLGKAISDAVAVSAVLREIGFDKVIDAHDVTRSALERSIEELAQTVGRGDTVFIFYSGHGLALEGADYVVPVDAPLPDGGDLRAVLREASISVESVVKTIKQREPENIVMVVDMPRMSYLATDDPSVASKRPADMNPIDGVFILFSTGLGQTALDSFSGDDKDPNSVFTRNLLPLLRKPGLTLVQIAKQLQQQVLVQTVKTGTAQRPAFYDTTVGDVILNRK
jgi:hypothetical protein